MSLTYWLNYRLPESKLGVVVRHLHLSGGQDRQTTGPVTNLTIELGLQEDHGDCVVTLTGLHRHDELVDVEHQLLVQAHAAGAGQAVVVAVGIDEVHGLVCFQVPEIVLSVRFVLPEVTVSFPRGGTNLGVVVVLLLPGRQVLHEGLVGVVQNVDGGWRDVEDKMIEVDAVI